MSAPSDKKKLRYGYTTGCCAAAAAKAATVMLVTNSAPKQVDLTLPDGTCHHFKVHRCDRTATQATASVIKDAGDDPDVTNGAEVGVTLSYGQKTDSEQIVLCNGEGVGTVTKRGLPIAPGEPAINPVPRQMIRQAITEVLRQNATKNRPITATVFVKNGELLAEKTLNRRLGIIGGLSILGTTGIVKPISTKAWTDTIEASMSVARAAGQSSVLLSTGRTSEKAVQELLNLPEESLIMMGDYLRYALQAAKRHEFKRVIVSAMWAKLLKAALGIPQTHVRHGALEPEHAAALLNELGLAAESAEKMAAANSARQIYEHLKEMNRDDLICAVCKKAHQRAQEWAGLDLELYLVTAEQGVVHHEPH